ncbi:MAG: hypothetical protein QXU59_07490 [Pyrobaculum sp.]
MTYLKFFIIQKYELSIYFIDIFYTVKEIEEIADVVVKKVARKSVGLYYTLWATFPPVVILLWLAEGGRR